MNYITNVEAISTSDVKQTHAIKVHRFENIPDALKQIPTWVCWKTELKENGKGLNKIPYISGSVNRFKQNDDELRDYATSLRAFKEENFHFKYEGLGFYLSHDWVVAAIDIDDCYDPEAGKFKTVKDLEGNEVCVETLINSIGSYAEFSQSGRGIHIFFNVLEKDEDVNRNFNNRESGVEFYERKIAISMTGNRIGDCNEINFYNPNAFCEQFKPKKLDLGEDAEESDFYETEEEKKHFDEQVKKNSDEELLNIALKNKRFSDIWNGNWQPHFPKLREQFDKISNNNVDQSLCNSLAYWTRKDADRIDRLFRQSALFQGDRAIKWDRKTSGSTYGRIAIDKAIVWQKKTSQPLTKEEWIRKQGDKEIDEAINNMNTNNEQNDEQDEEGAETEETSKKKAGPTAADILMRTANENTIYFRDKSKMAYAEISEDGKTHLFYLKSDEYKERLLLKHYKKTGRILATRGVVDAVISTLSASTIENPVREVFLRKAFFDGNLYYDMGDETGRVIEITSEGWKMISKSPIPFIRADSTLPQFEPKKGGDIGMLKKLVNVRDEDFILLVGWMMGFFLPRGTQPILNFKSGEGTAKTTTTNNTRNILDPNNDPSRETPENKDDFNLAARNNAVVAFENLTFIPKWMSNALCCLSTGSSSPTRKFHTQLEETKFKAKRPIIINGIPEIVTKPDLLDRLVKLELPKLASYGDEGELEEEFKKLAPYIFDVLLTAAAEGLKNLPNVEIGKAKDRTVNFMKWVCACAPALGFTQEEFLKAYEANRGKSKGMSVELSSLGSELESWAREQESKVDRDGKSQIFYGQTKELVKKLEQHAGYGYESYDDRPPRDWPDTPQSAGRQLQLLNATLLSRGLEITEAKKIKGYMKFKIFKVETDEVEEETEEDDLNPKQLIPDFEFDSLDI